MASKSFLLSLISLSLLISACIGERVLELSEGQQCRFQRLNAAQPSQRIQSEGGLMEIWGQREEQFQCAGIAAMRNTLRPNALSLPNYQPSPRLVFVERGQGFIGITFPGCAETYHSQRSQRTREFREGEQQQQQQQQEGRSSSDFHQKVHRIRRGDIIAIPAGAAHWCYNDGNEELVAISINDLNHLSNQLDQRFRAFYLAGGVPRGQQQQGQEEYNMFQNIFRPFDSNFLAEAYNVNPEIINRMQRGQEERGLIIIVQEPMRFLRPDEEERQERFGGQGGQFDNGFEETFCTMKFTHNMEHNRESDIYSREAGRVHVVDRFKLPILKYMDLSAERGNLYSNALLSPDWSMNGHTIVYVTQGDAQIEITNHNGDTMMNDRVNQGDMFVVPQYHTSIARAGNNGFEWIAFKTTGWPMRNPLVGYTSIMRAMPLQVLTNAYQISPNQAQALKMNRGGQSFLLSPGSRRQY